jgi:valyl-tRNA synthetase
MACVMGIVDTVRNIRGEMGVHPSRQVDLRLRVPPGGEMEEAVRCSSSYITRLAGVSSIEYGMPPRDRGPVAAGVVEGIEIWVPLGDVIDIEVEKNRLNKEIERIKGLLERSASRVANPEFNRKAPPDVVAAEKAKMERMEENLAKLKRNLSVLLGS